MSVCTSCRPTTLHRAKYMAATATQWIDAHKKAMQFYFIAANSSGSGDDGDSQRTLLDTGSILRDDNVDDDDDDNEKKMRLIEKEITVNHERQA